MNRTSYAAQFNEAARAAQSGDHARAVALAQTMLQANPKDPNALQVLGLALAGQGRLYEALDAFRRANDIAPGQPPILSMR